MDYLTIQETIDLDLFAEEHHLLPENLLAHPNNAFLLERSRVMLGKRFILFLHEGDIIYLPGHNVSVPMHESLLTLSPFIVLTPTYVMTLEQFAKYHNHSANEILELPQNHFLTKKSRYFGQHSLLLNIEDAITLYSEKIASTQRKPFT